MSIAKGSSAVELKLHGRKRVENVFSGSLLLFIHFENRKKKGSPFHLEHDREQVGGKEEDKDRLVSPRGAEAGEQRVHRHRGGVRLQGGERGHCPSLGGHGCHSGS